MSHRNLDYILIVNSEPDVADLFAEMLLMDAKKYVINTAHTGKDCLLTINRDKPGMILMDMELPDMKGWDLIKQIKDSQPDMPIVIVTAKLPEIDDFSQFSMVSDYLVMPVTIDCLLVAVRDALEIPVILDRCIETVKGRKGSEGHILEANIMLLKQSIGYRKLLILMEQLYPGKKLQDYPNIRSMMDTLRLEIGRMHSELETFKRDCLIV
ncbi:MAG TPA: response regulator [Candidatus Methanoperedens sp.]